jgi:hypothetical protein
MERAEANPLLRLKDTQADAWFTPVRFAVMLFVFLVAAYPDMFLFVFTDRTFFFRDFGYFGYPLAHYYRESFWRGELPLWNPLSNCGLPFLAQWNTLVLYPGSLFYLLLPLSWALGFFCLGHLLLAGVGMYHLSYRWTGNRLAASVAGLAFAFNGLSLNCLMWPNNVAALGWMPVIVLAVEWACREGGRRLIWAALAGAMQMLTGAPEFILFTWVFLGMLVLGHWIRGRPGRPLWVGRFLLLVILVAGLTAAQTFPFLELLSQSQRSSGFAVTDWSMPGTGWANLLVPMFHTLQKRQGVWFQQGQLWTSSYYLGIAVIALALLAMGRIRERRVGLLVAASLAGLILALGDQGYVFAWLRKGIPQFGFMRFPIKFIVALTFSVPLLAAFAVQRHQLLDPDKLGRFWRWALLLGGGFCVLVAGILWFEFRHPLVEGAQTETWPNTWHSGSSRAAFLVLGLGALFALRQVTRPQTRILLRLGFLLLLGLDVLTHAPRQNPTVPRWLFTANLPKLVPESRMKPQPEHGQSRAMLSLPADMWHRFHATDQPVNDYYFSRRGLFSNCNLLDGLPKVNGFFSLYPREADRVIGLLYSPTNFLLSTNRTHPALYDFLSVSQVTAPGKPMDWEPRESYLPMVTAGARPVFADEPTTLQALFSPGFAPRDEVYLPLEARASVSARPDPSARVSETRFSAHRIGLEIQAAQPSVLVFSQAYYPSWRAYVDGQPVRIWPANLGFQALEVPGGPRAHTVRLAYEDRSFQGGLLVTGLTLVACLALWLRLRSEPNAAARHGGQAGPATRTG